MDEDIVRCAGVAAYRGNDAYSVICRPDFITEAINNADCFFTLDIAHAMITAKAFSMNIYDYLKKLPLNKCKEVHLSKPDGAKDAHDFPDKEVMGLFSFVQPDIMQDAYVVVEYYKDRDKLKSFLEELVCLLK